MFEIVEDMVKIPAFAGDAKKGHLVTLVRPGSVSGETTELTGWVTGLERKTDITRPVISFTITNPDGETMLNVAPNTHTFHLFPTMAPDEIAMTIGRPEVWGHGLESGLHDDEGLVCRRCFIKTDVFCAAFRKMDLEPNECCKRCGENLCPQDDDSPNATISGTPVGTNGRLLIDDANTIDTSKYMVCDGVAWTVDLNARALYVCNMVGDGHLHPDWENVLIADDVENWEGTVWADGIPTRAQIDMVRTLVAAALNITGE